MHIGKYRNILFQVRFFLTIVNLNLANFLLPEHCVTRAISYFILHSFSNVLDITAGSLMVIDSGKRSVL
jgi:hypothetical protein